MKALKRWTTTIGSSFDWVISQVENHEALVSTAIREMQQAFGKAQAQLVRVKKDGTAMRERLTQLKTAAVQWEERAVATHATDPQKAMECVRRKKRVEREALQLETNISEHAKLETQLTQDLQTIRVRIDELKRKKNALAAREYRAQAARAGQCEDIGIINEIDDIFDRWETRVASCEVFDINLDSLEDEFIQEEHEQELKLELAGLIAKHQ